MIDQVNYVIIILSQNEVTLFLSQTTLPSCLTLLLRYLIVTLQSCSYRFLSFFLTLLFVLQWLSLHWKIGILIMLLSQFPWTILKPQKAIPLFIAQLMTILMLIGTVYLRDVSWEDIFRFSASAAATKFCKWVQVGIEVYIPHRKCEVTFHLLPWFSATYAAAISLRNHFFCLDQENKSFTSKVEFGQVNNRSKRVFEECITCQKLGSRIADSVFNKGTIH